MVICLVMVGQIRLLRENRRRGIKIDWSRGLLVAGACILITLIGFACMLAANALGQPMVGVGLFVLILIVGLIILAVAANRHWPRPGPRQGGA
jgi:amino acid transporter